MAFPRRHLGTGRRDHRRNRHAGDRPAAGRGDWWADDRSYPTRPRAGRSRFFWPEWLPGGRAVLFTITAVTGGLDAAQVAILDLQTGTSRILVRGGSHGHYVPSGPGSPKRVEREGSHLVYAAAGTLRAVPFDLARLETRGTPVPVVPAVVTTNFGAWTLRWLATARWPMCRVAA